MFIKENIFKPDFFLIYGFRKCGQIKNGISEINDYIYPGTHFWTQII